LVHATGSPGALGIGALAIGDVKYRLQNRLLALLLTTDKPAFLDFRAAFEAARELV
jgi:methylene-tetrahydromethanopterin dehydrogenase